ncbi:hypothetical protein [Fibrobacter sp. UWB7]|uniref:hypothetical protein n=1 Tax=Fibrobacter sp. UWB7 TaxID=1896206 RepID=UPI00091E06BA|nr:hypothetical protein [Fibrobacter sp. UWB7]SHM06287.1 hypothetical protein SAMN05720467_0460 [Fibrobacter sp. UWB7]
MSVNSYEEFLENPLKLDERFPTIEEVLLATGHFFIKTNVELFKALKDKIEDAKDGKRNLDWYDLPDFISCFDLGNLENPYIWWTYLDVHEKYSQQSTYKNVFICTIMMNVFLKRWNLENGIHWLKDPPKEAKPFTHYLKSELAPKIQNASNRVKDNYRKWIENESTPSIESFIDFWNSIAESIKDDVIPQREILFAYWFWQKFQDDFNLNYKEKDFDEDAFSNKIHEIIILLTERKKIDSLEKVEILLCELKKENIPGLYPYFLLFNIFHLIYQRKYKELLPYIDCMSKIFFVLPHFLHEPFYSRLMSCIAYLHQSDCIDKHEKKKLVAIFKRLYETGIYFGLLDSSPLSKNPKENIDANIHRWSRRFEELFPRENFYGMQHKIDDSLTLPKPNPKKADSFYINFGECINSPQISFFARLNDLDAVNKLLKNKTIQVTKIGEQNDSAIFWSLVNMSLMNPYGFKLQTIFPPTAKYFKRKDVLKLLAPYTTKHFNEQEYKEAYAQQIDIATHIFYKLVNRCKNAPLRNKSLDDFETSFSITKIGNESILQNAMYTANFDIVKNIIELYKHFVPNKDLVKKWINEKAGFAPAPAIYHIVRIFSNKQHVDLHLEEPLFHYNRLVDNGVNAEYQQILYPTLATSMPEKIREIEQQWNITNNTRIMPVIARNHYIIIQKYVHEAECLKILQLLLENGADPLIEINMEHEDNGPKSYNALKFATEIGWLQGVKLMCEHVKKTHFMTQEMIDEWLKVAVGWEDQWLRLWKDVPYSEQYAQKCHEVVDYLQALNPTN